MPSGRPSSYTEELADRICEAVATNAVGLEHICKANDFPNPSTIDAWRKAHPDFDKKYALAKERQAEKLAYETIAIADDGSRDVRIDDEGNEVVDHDHIARSRLRVDARKWLAGKLSGRFSEKVAVGGAADMPPVAVAGKITVEFVSPPDLEDDDAS
jgi:transposase-like protein